MDMAKGEVDILNVYVTRENTDCITWARFFGVGECGVGFLLLLIF